MPSLRILAYWKAGEFSGLRTMRDTMSRLPNPEKIFSVQILNLTAAGYTCTFADVSNGIDQWMEANRSRFAGANYGCGFIVS